MNTQSDLSKIQLQCHYQIQQLFIQDEQIKENAFFELEAIVIDKKRVHREDQQYYKQAQKHYVLFTTYRFFVFQLTNLKYSFLLSDLEEAKPFIQKTIKHDHREYYQLNFKDGIVNNDIVCSLEKRDKMAFQENLKISDARRFLLLEDELKAKALFRQQNADVMNRYLKLTVAGNGLIEEELFWEQQEEFSEIKKEVLSKSQKMESDNYKEFSEDLIISIPQYPMRVFGMNNIVKAQPANIYEISYRDDLEMIFDDDNDYSQFQRNRPPKKKDQEKRNAQIEQFEANLAMQQIDEQCQVQYLKHGSNVRQSMENLLHPAIVQKQLAQILPEMDLKYNEGIPFSSEGGMIVEDISMKKHKIYQDKIYASYTWDKQCLEKELNSAEFVGKVYNKIDLINQNVIINDYKRSFEITENKKKSIEEKESLSLNKVRLLYSDIRRFLQKLYMILDRENTEAKKQGAKNEVELLLNQLEEQKKSIRDQIQERTKSFKTDSKSDDFIIRMLEDLQKMIECGQNKSRYLY